MSDFKFVHAADLHLDSPYKGIRDYNEGLGEALRKAGRRAFENLIDLCVDEKVDFLLISGDSFDSGSGSLAAQSYFIKGMKNLEKHDIGVYLICGNHDPLKSWSSGLQMPDNVTRFESDLPEAVFFEKKGDKKAVIYGHSFLKKEEFRNLAAEFSHHHPSLFGIGMLHGNLSSHTGHEPYCPFSAEDLRVSGMDYWALGHIHKREVVLGGAPLAIYPGNIQGRHFNESGDKGCYLVEVRGKTIADYSFKSLSPLLFERAELDLSEINGADGFVDGFRELEQSYREAHPGKSFLVKAVLRGRSRLFNSLMDEKELDALIDEVNHGVQFDEDFVFFDRPVNKTGPVIDLDERKESSDFVADLLKEFEKLKGDEELVSNHLESIVDELRGHLSYRHIKEYRPEWQSPEGQREFLEAALQRCIYGLFEREEEDS